MRVYLLGFMGSGKSFLGSQLSSYLNWNYIDLDQQIEQSTNKNITEIFKENGESYFRQEESKALKETSESDHVIISTGGGTPCFNENMTWIKKHGKSVYLCVSPEILLGRLLDKRIERPLLHNMNMDELTSFIKSELKMREIFYKKADLILDADIFSASLLNAIEDLCQKD